MRLGWVVLGLVALASNARAQLVCTATACCSGSSCAQQGCSPNTAPAGTTQAQCDAQVQDYLRTCMLLGGDCSGSSTSCTCTTPGGGSGGGGFGGPNINIKGGSASGAPNPPASTNLLGPAMGLPFFSSIPLGDNEGIRRDTSARWSYARTSYSQSGARGSARSGGRGRGLDAHHQASHRTPGCFYVAQQAKLSFFSSMSPTTHPIAESFWPPFAAPSTIDGSQGQPVTGGGAGYGPRDIPPNPNPQPVNNIRECNNGWFFNPATRTCYFTQASCQYGGQACVPSPNQDPSLNGAADPPGFNQPGHVQSWNDCSTNTSYNDCTRACYGAGACQNASSQPGCQCIPGTHP